MRETLGVLKLFGGYCKNEKELELRNFELICVCCSGNKPNYLGVQKNPPALALCPATNNCISTSENISDLVHYAPPW